MRLLVVLTAARRDISDVCSWYQSRRVQTSHAFRADVAAAIELIALDPLKWACVEGNIHRYLLKRFPFTVFCDVTETRVRVLAVAHQRRREAFWKERIPGS